MINLVAFDVCDVNKIRLVRQVNPLNYTIVCPILHPIPKELHAQLRKSLKSYSKDLGVLLGRVSFDRELHLAVYKKTLRSAAYVHGESPQDKRS